MCEGEGEASFNSFFLFFFFFFNFNCQLLGQFVNEHDSLFSFLLDNVPVCIFAWFVCMVNE